MTSEDICKTRTHCKACRTKPEFRAKLGIPEECPHGVTLENLPKPPRYVVSTASDHEKQGRISGCCDRADQD